MQSAMAQQPTAFGRLLGVLDSLLAASMEIVVVGDGQDPATRALVEVARRRFLPSAVLARMEPGSEPLLPLFAGRLLVDGKPAAYVCENYACKLPVTTVEELRKAIGER